MELVQDDATSLTAFEDSTIDAVVDKGMMDALFCASRPDILMQVMKSVNRVLLPGGIYGFFSFSRPEFLLKQLLEPIDGKDDNSHDVLGFKKRRSRKDLNGNKTMWKDVQVRALENILFYRFEKADGEVDDLESSSDSRSARITRQKRQRMQRRKQ
jgi:ubiquinone/menaquinone biosynthesis C-methylase UbiE